MSDERYRHHEEEEQWDGGDGYKAGVIAATTIAALVFLGIILFLFYYLCARKWIQQRKQGPLRDDGHNVVYRVGDNQKVLPEKDYYRQPKFVARDDEGYRSGQIDASFDKEPSMIRNSDLTNSSFGGGNNSPNSRRPSNTMMGSAV